MNRGRRCPRGAPQRTPRCRHCRYYSSGRPLGPSPRMPGSVPSPRRPSRATQSPEFALHERGRIEFSCVALPSVVDVVGFQLEGHRRNRHIARLGHQGCFEQANVMGSAQAIPRGVAQAPAIRCSSGNAALADSGNRRSPVFLGPRHRGTATPRATACQADESPDRPPSPKTLVLTDGRPMSGSRRSGPSRCPET
jgi:hypothetical protein